VTPGPDAPSRAQDAVSPAAAGTCTPPLLQQSIHIPQHLATGPSPNNGRSRSTSTLPHPNAEASCGRDGGTETGLFGGDVDVEGPNHGEFMHVFSVLEYFIDVLGTDSHCTSGARHQC
jgi:hypothetical protein